MTGISCKGAAEHVETHDLVRAWLLALLEEVEVVEQVVECIGHKMSEEDCVIFIVKLVGKRKSVQLSVLGMQIKLV